MCDTLSTSSIEACGRYLRIVTVSIGVYVIIRYDRSCGRWRGICHTGREQSRLGSETNKNTEELVRSGFSQSVGCSSCSRLNCCGADST